MSCASANPSIGCSGRRRDDVHVHVWGDGDPEVDRYLVFRDRLRASPDDRSEYERLKRSLAQREWSDMNHYADAKGPVIEAILARARQSRIRPARSTDAGAVAGLLGALGYPTDADAAAAQLEPLLDRDDTGVLVYVDDGEPVGLIATTCSISSTDRARSAGSRHWLCEPTGAARVSRVRCWERSRQSPAAGIAIASS